MKILFATTNKKIDRIKKIIKDRDSNLISLSDSDLSE